MKGGGWLHSKNYAGGFAVSHDGAVDMYECGPAV